MNQHVILHQIGYDRYYKVWHTTEQNMLIYMHSDGGCIVCREKIYPIVKGTLCFIGAKKYHYTMPQDTVSYDRSKVFMPVDLFQTLMTLLEDGSSIRTALNSEALVYAQIPPHIQPSVEALFHEIAVSKGPNRDATFLICYLKLLIYLENHTVDSISAPRSLLSDAVDYINTNIQNTLQLDDICKAVHMSKYHFCRQFKKATGVTVMDYISKTRLSLAKNLLRMDDLSVSQISSQCGFSSTSLFCRAFKSDTGLTPLQYRKEKNT